jgi:hypothetical protein
MIGWHIYDSVKKRLEFACRKPYSAISHKKIQKPEKATFSHKLSRFSKLTRKPDFEPKTDFFTNL